MSDHSTLCSYRYSSGYLILRHVAFFQLDFRATSINMRGRLRQLFLILSDDNVGSGPRPEPHSLQDPLNTFPQAELVEQAVEQIRQDHMYTASPKTTPQASQQSPAPHTSKQGVQSGSSTKRKSDDTAVKSGKKR
jgi:hypothetical protein